MHDGPASEVAGGHGWYVRRVHDADELLALRSRPVKSALAERRRIERALHDSAQQDLIAISVRLQLVRELVPTAPADALTLLDDVQQGARDALDRLRTLASEIYPSILDARGLPDPLRTAARASPALWRITRPHAPSAASVGAG